MLQQPLDYFRPTAPPSSWIRRWFITWAALAAVVLVNLGLLTVAWWDSSFLALRIAFQDSNRANIASSIACLALAPLVWKRSGAVVALAHASFSVLVPYVAAWGVPLLIGNMNLHGS